MNIPASPWARLAERSELTEKGRLVVKTGGKQLLIIDTSKGIFVCNNRCPHEGFPLKEASLSGGAVLTCNWHNWKFDLETGETLVGGDCVRRYPVEIRDGAIWADLSDPPEDNIRQRVIANLREAYDDYDYTRIARELARLQKAAGETKSALAAMICEAANKFEYGNSHVPPAAADWLTLAQNHARDNTERLAVMLEIHAHFAFDTQRMPSIPFTEDYQDWNEAAFLDAMETEDETKAAALARGALEAGMAFSDLRPAFAKAALAHYASFGHAAIEVVKTGELIAHLDSAPEVTETLVCWLVRSIVYARREDLIPEFRAYGPAFKAWTGSGTARPEAKDYRGLGPEAALDLTLTGSADTQNLYHALLGAGAWNMLHYDLSLDFQTDKSIAYNVGWLNFTHAITFANAVRQLCEETPSLWPAGLLQMALFAGRNAKFTVDRLDDDWNVPDAAAFFDGITERLFDHGEIRHIIVAHLVKLRQAALEELAAAPDAPWREDLLASLNRFYNSPMRHRHMRRSAVQALNFVASEG